MGISKEIRQYWPLVIVTFAFIWGLPYLTGHGERRPGLAGITRGVSSLSQDNEFAELAAKKYQVGYTRPANLLPFYGFDELSLNSPVFQSWWDGKAAIAGAKLKELNANTAVLGEIWKDSLRFHDTVARMHGNGVKIIVQVTEPQDWVELAEDPSGRLQPIPSTFVTNRASSVLAQARNQGVGHFADFILIGGDAMSFANQVQRQKMYQLTKQYFPNTPIVRRYGTNLERAEGLQAKPHPMGGTWDEYAFGADECDIAIVTVGRGVDEGRVGVKVSSVLEQLNHIVSIVKSRQNEASIIVTAEFGDAGLLSNTKTAMWSPKEIDQYVTAILTSAAVDGLLLKGLGHFAFDLGHPDFSAQREAFRDAAPARSPAEEIAAAAINDNSRSPASTLTR